VGLVVVGGKGTFEGEIAFSDVGLGWDLMGVYAVSESKLFCSMGIFFPEIVGDGKIIVCSLQEGLQVNSPYRHNGRYPPETGIWVP